MKRKQCQYMVAKTNERCYLGEHHTGEHEPEDEHDHEWIDDARYGNGVGNYAMWCRCGATRRLIVEIQDNDDKVITETITMPKRVKDVDYPHQPA